MQVVEPLRIDETEKLPLADRAAKRRAQRRVRASGSARGERGRQAELRL